LRALEFAFLLHEIRGASGAEAGKVGRRGFGFAEMPLHSRFGHFHFRKLHLQGPIRKRDVSQVATLQLAAAIQNPGMKEYPIEIANRDGFTLLNSTLLWTM
jgi:hypothetical protein